MATTRTLDPAILRDVCDVIADTDTGLTNREIDDLLTEAGIDDPNKQPLNPNVYRAINKRSRLFEALHMRLREDKSANAVLVFIELVMRPVRFRGVPCAFSHWQDELNQTLSFAGLRITDEGKLARLSRPATTLDQARARARRLRKTLIERGCHSRIIAACGNEIADENYFHTVFEATKTVAEEIRQQAGLTSDGHRLVDEAFEKGPSGYPRLAFNALHTQTDWSEHRGFAHMLRGMFSAIRNPTAHKPKVTWHISEQDALDTLAFLSMLHRTLDRCTLVPVPVSATSAPV
jgi:uncharacterized protein (TIGR02391 family)